MIHAWSDSLPGPRRYLAYAPTEGALAVLPDTVSLKGHGSGIAGWAGWASRRTRVTKATFFRDKAWMSVRTAIYIHVILVYA